MSFGRDTKSRRSLISGVYARGSKRPHQSALECVTVVDSTAHSKLPQKCVYAAENAACTEKEEVRNEALNASSAKFKSRLRVDYDSSKHIPAGIHLERGFASMLRPPVKRHTIFCHACPSPALLSTACAIVINKN